MDHSIEDYRAALKRELPAIAARYGVTSLGLFGSRVRGNARADSDLDVLVSFLRPPSLLQLVELENALSDRLEVKVDLVVRESLKPGIGRRILAELAPL